MISLQTDVKNFYTVRLENLQTEVSGFHLTHARAAELGFEEIAGLDDVIEETRFLEAADGWDVYVICWKTEAREPFGKGESRFARVYVHRIEPAKEAKAIISRKRARRANRCP